jgi:hypothetical protein
MKVEKSSSPECLCDCMRIALLGEVYPNIRAIAIKLTNNRVINIRYYLDREPTNDDYESVDMVASNLEASMPLGYFKELNTECVFSNDPISELDSLNGFYYARREYEM